MTTLQVFVDDLTGTEPSGLGRTAQELTRQLIATAPAGCIVEGIVSAVGAGERARVLERLPGLAGLRVLPARRRALEVAWAAGTPGLKLGGMVHSPSLFAPLGSHDRLNSGDQLSVTIHDTLAWTAPDELPASQVLWTKTMARRARRFADVVVVPTHAVAGRLSELIDFGDRIRVIGGAPASTFRLPPDADERAARLGLPERFVLTMGSISPRKAVAEMVKAMAFPDAGSLPLIIVGPDLYRGHRATGVAAAAGLPEGRVRALGVLSDEDLAVTLHRATVFVYPSREEGFGMPLVDAFQFGTPVIHSDDEALVEVAGGAGMIVPRRPDDTYPARLAAAVGAVVNDPTTAARLRVLASDRARAFSWRDSAERLWQLHADL